LTYGKLRISNEEIWNAISHAIAICVWEGGGFTVTPGKKGPVFVSPTFRICLALAWPAVETTQQMAEVGL
jgi:hypothetical protein